MTTPPTDHRWRRRLGWTATTLSAGAGAIAAALTLTPRPSSWVIRRAFDKAGAATNGALAAHVPDGVSGITGLAYGATSRDTLLDVWAPDDAARPLPVVVWVHGGGWVSGSRSQVANYLKIIAGSGYAVVGIDYTLAPGATYPTPVRQLDDAIGYVRARAAELNLDASRIVLAGDSAGAHIAAQYAALVTDPAYAAEVGIDPSLDASALVGTVLHCGPYVPSMVQDARGVGGWFVRTVAWAYIGTKDFDSPVMRQADVVQHVTPTFPPTWISGGNGDPLTQQGRALADRLAALDVEVTSAFFAEDHTPTLGHEFQFDLTLEDSRRVLEGTLRFLRVVCGGNELS